MRSRDSFKLPRSIRLATITLIGILCVSVAWGQDWPQWRGPQRDGHVLGISPPASWPQSWKLAWQLEVGEGHSSPVVAGDTVYILSREGEEEVVRAVALADGKVLWCQKYPAPYEVNPAAHAHGKGPKSTPVVYQDKLVTLGISGILSCWSTSRGEQQWQHTFQNRFRETSPDFGTATSPIVLDGDKVLAFVGGPDSGAFAAWELATGKTVWEWTGDTPAYSSPILARLAGKSQIVIQSRRFTSGVDPKSGQVLWQIPFTTQYDVNIVTPVVWKDLLILSGFRRGTSAYRIVTEGDKFVPQLAWQNKEVSMYMNSPVLVGGRLVGFAQEQRGQFFAMDPDSGKIFWRSEPRQGENAALLVLGEFVLALTTGSELVVFNPSADTFQPLARWKVANTPTWAHPVWSSRGLVVKDARHLSLWVPALASAE